jgi:sugar lactone lactonase YvrE
MKVDTKGNIYESGPGGTWVLSPEGNHLGTIRTSEFVASVAFGDADNKTHCIAARTSIYKIRVNTPGIR